ncbi:MAG: uroporphyrinogen-III synthase, partial [Bacillales bacterium]|nr:uroporphyrinogen-III synthase [Bacillales bacterium]
FAFQHARDPREEEFLRRLETFDWVIFTSKNGVDFFFQTLAERAVNPQKKILAKFAVVGAKTEQALKKHGFQADFIPDQYTADEFVRCIQNGRFRAERALLPKGNLAKESIARALRAKGASAEEWVVYDTIFPKESEEKLVSLLNHDILDVACFTSPSTVRHFMKVVDKHQLKQHLSRLFFASIGPVTSKELKDYSLPVHICPKEYTMDALILEICAFYKKEET